MKNFTQDFYLYLALPVALLVVLEGLYGHTTKKHAYHASDVLASCVLGIGSFLMELATKGVVLYLLTFFYKIRLLEPVSNPYVYWTTLLIAQDLLYYCCHCAEHSCRILWASHLPHHSSEEFNITTGFRASVFKFAYRYFFFIPLALLGFEPIHIMLLYMAGQAHGILVHTRHLGKLGWLEWIFVTPSHHRVHHASNERYLDKNMGQIFIIWDRLFGTFEPECDEEPVRYGITKPVNANDPLDVIVLEYTDIYKDLQQPNLRWSDQLKYVFGRPGWKHKPIGDTKKFAKKLRLFTKNS